jgi:hypothetical protein
MFAWATSGLSTPGVRSTSAWYGPLDEDPCGEKTAMASRMSATATSAARNDIRARCVRRCVLASCQEQPWPSRDRCYVGQRMLTSDQKGNVAEAAVVAAAVKLGIDVYKPIGSGGRYDMIFEVHSQLLRIQCKWAPRHGDVVVLRCYSSRRSRDGLQRRKYLKGEIDAFAAYCPDTDRCYFLPFEVFTARTQVSLRLGPSKNNQSLGINWAKNYEFTATLGAPGAIAQLGERRRGTPKVAGSSPAGSTL